MSPSTAPPSVHDSAIVHPNARIAPGVVIGPYAVVGEAVSIGEDAVIGAHVTVDGATDIGPGVRVFPFAALGGEPQHRRYRGEETRLSIGAGTIIREHTTLHLGTAQGGGITRVGERCMLMVGTHVAHDCQVGNDVLLAQGAIIGGHVTVGDHAALGAQAGVHQMCRIGPHAMVGAKCGVFEDLIPYGICRGARAALEGVNLVGMRGRGYSASTIRALQREVERLFECGEPLATSARRLLEDRGAIAEAREVAAFLLAEAHRPVMRPASG